MLKIVLCGGGSAGHIMPHLALIDGLKKIFDEIHYIGSRGGIEKDIISPNIEIFYHEITCAKLRRKLSLKNFLIPINLAKGIFETRKLLKKIKPDIIFSKGGYVSVPVIFGANKHCPIFIHESDMSLGLANKLCVRKADKILTAFEATANKYKKGVHTGIPLRPDIYSGNREKIFKELGIGHRPVLVIMGGSLGSQKINEVLRASLNRLLIKFDIIHLTGKGNIDTRYNNPNYFQFEFRMDIKDIFAAADIIVSRAGSTTIFELAALKKPMLLIPLPKDESRGDQILNAKYFEERKYSNVLMQENLTATKLIDAITYVYNNKNIYINNLKNLNDIDGTQKILDLICEKIRQN